jgi:hypothetical protein
MNRRNVISIVAVMLMIPMGLVAAPKKGKPPTASCKDCKKCGDTCNCNCKKKCRCKPGCCKADRPSPHGKPPRGFDGRTPDFQPPHSKPARGFDGRTPNFGPPSRSRSPQGRPSSDRHSRYKEIISKFDKNNDGKLDEKERDEAKKYFMSRYRNYKK